MGDTQIPPTTPPQLQLSTQKSAPVAAASPTPPIKAVVRDAPLPLRKPDKPVAVEGRVVSTNKNTGESVIATDSGEITVETTTPLPPDADVYVELYMQQSAALANIAVLKREAAMAQEIVQPQQRPPDTVPLKEGDIVTAILLPDAPPPVTVDPAKPADPSLPPEIVAETEITELAVVFAKLPPMEASALLRSLPPPPLPLQDVMTAEFPAETFRALPPDSKAQIMEYLAKPAVRDTIEKLFPDLAPKNPLPIPQSFTAPAPAPVPVDDPLAQLDNNILKIVTAQISVRMTHDAVTENAPPAAPVTTSAFSVLKSILPLLQTVDTSQTKTPMPSMLNPLTAPLQDVQKQQNQPQNLVEAKAVKIILPGIAPPKPTAQQVLGTVEYTTPRGFPVVKTPGGHMVLKSAVSIPEGSTVLFEIHPVTVDQLAEQARAAAQSAAPAPVFDPLTAPLWPALQDSLRSLDQAALQQKADVTQTVMTDAANAMRNTIPTASPKLVPTALFFLAALRIGTIDSWLGSNTINALRQSGKKDLAERLTGDFGRMSAQSKQPLDGEWRSISMPLMHDDQMSQLQFFIRRQQDADDNNENGKREPMTRFLLNLNLSKMGDMQLDGLLRQKKFDLILRSTDALPEDMRRDLMQAFAKGLQQINMQGAISFQIKSQNWVTVELPHHAGTVA